MVGLTILWPGTCIDFAIGLPIWSYVGADPGGGGDGGLTRVV